MDSITWIVLFVLAGVAVYAVTLWRRVAKLEAGMRSETRLLEEKRDEAEKARKEARERREELERAKKQLEEARNKLKKREKDDQPAPAKKSKGPQEDREQAAAPSPVIVRISDQELSAEHQRKVQGLEDELAAVRAELAAAKRREDDRAREAERASRAIAEAVAAPVQAAPVQAPPPVAPESSDGAVNELRAQLDAMKKAAVERERELKREIRRAQDETKHAQRRSANNQALYAVLKGQLELAEDRLAAYRLKYEGAKSIDELRRESKKDKPKKGRRDRQGNGTIEQVKGEEAAAEAPSHESLPVPEAVAEQAEPALETAEGAPSTLEVSNQDIVSTHPVPASDADQK